MELNIKNILQEIIVDKYRTKNVSLVVKYINSIQAENKELKEKLSSLEKALVKVSEGHHRLETKLEAIESNKVAEFKGEWTGTYYGLDMYAVKDFDDEGAYIPDATFPFRVTISKETK